jgi:hypothetical protein
VPTSSEAKSARQSPTGFRWAWLAPVLTLAAGCGGGETRVERFPASGMVRVDGKPAGGVQVMLHPADGIGDLDALKPTATSDAEGAFQVGTYGKGDGAPAGRYKVTLYLPASPPTGSNSPDDLLGGRYLDPATSPLEATIGAEQNRLGPFEVSKAARPPRSPKNRPSRPDADGVG